jgi:hypothetical protein
MEFTHRFVASHAVVWVRLGSIASLTSRTPTPKTIYYAIKYGLDAQHHFWWVLDEQRVSTWWVQSKQVMTKTRFHKVFSRELRTYLLVA